MDRGTLGATVQGVRKSQTRWGHYPTTITYMYITSSLSWNWTSLSRVQLCNPMDSTVHGILQARILEWVAFPFSGGLPNIMSFWTSYFVMDYSKLAVFWWLQVDSKGTQPCIYMYPFSPKLQQYSEVFSNLLTSNYSLLVHKKYHRLL